MTTTEPRLDDIQKRSFPRGFRVPSRFVRRNIAILQCDTARHGMAETRFATMATSH
jgi:hypothetical protein